MIDAWVSDEVRLVHPRISFLPDAGGRNPSGSALIVWRPRPQYRRAGRARWEHWSWK